MYVQASKGHTIEFMSALYLDMDNLPGHTGQHKKQHHCMLMTMVTYHRQSMYVMYMLHAYLQPAQTSNYCPPGRKGVMSFTLYTLTDGIIALSRDHRKARAVHTCVTRCWTYTGLVHQADIPWLCSSCEQQACMERLAHKTETSFPILQESAYFRRVRPSP